MFRHDGQMMVVAVVVGVGKSDRVDRDHQTESGQEELVGFQWTILLGGGAQCCVLLDFPQQQPIEILSHFINRSAPISIIIFLLPTVIHQLPLLLLPLDL